MNSLIQKLYKISFPLLLAGCVAGTTPVAYQPTPTPKRDETRIAEVTPIPIYTPTPVYTPTPTRPRIAEFMDELRKYRALVETAFEIEHYTNEVLNFDDLSSSYMCFRIPDDWDQPPGNWDEVRTCLSQVEGALSNLMQKIIDANMLFFINQSSSGKFQETYNGIQEAIQELKRYARFEDTFKYNQLAYEFEAPSGIQGFGTLAFYVDRLPSYLIGWDSLDSPIRTDVFERYFEGRCCGQWVISGSVADAIEKSVYSFKSISDFWIYDQVLKNEIHQLKDYFYGYDYPRGDFVIFEYINSADAESAVQRLYNIVKVDELPLVIDGWEFNMIYWRQLDMNQNMYALITRHDNFLMVVNPSTEIKEENDKVASLLVNTLLAS